MVRAAAPVEAWSTGVSLARSGAVRFETVDAEEIKARVRLEGAAVAPAVILYPEDSDWECDCGSGLAACEHVAAVVIAHRQGGARSESSPSRTIEYRLKRTPEGLYLERGVSEEGAFHRLDASLEAVASGAVPGPELVASPADLAVEKALRGRYRGVLPKERLGEIFRALAGTRVTLEGQAVRVSAEPRRPRILVEDAPGGGFRLRLVVPEVWDPESKTLAPVADARLSGRERHDLDRGRIYRGGEVSELVGALLPSLGRRLPVEIRTAKLPRQTRERPRPAVNLKRRGDSLVARFGIVYGDPPAARLEDGQLVATGNVVPVRQGDAERAVAKRLERELGVVPGAEIVLETAEAIDFVKRLERFDGHVEGDGRRFFREHPALVPERSDDELGVSFSRASPRAVAEAWRRGETYVNVEGGGYAPLPADWLDRYGDALLDLLAARELSGEMPKAVAFDRARIEAGLEGSAPPELGPLRALLDASDSLPEAPLMPELRRALRGYQRAGVDWLHALKRAGLGAILADDMGLGKTVQTLAVLEGPSLVVAPTSVLHNWMEEARRFRPELTLCLYHGTGRVLDEGADVVVTSHALLRLDRERLCAREWDTAVIDEAQAIRNPDTDLARAAFSLRAQFRVSLTGTPVENRLEDLWSQSHFTNPGLLGSRSDFDERYARTVSHGESDKLARLSQRMRPFLLRRLKREVAPELPPRTEVVLRAELSDEERTLYDALRLAARDDVVRRLDAGASAIAVLEALLRLRQAACHPALVPGRSASTSSKVELLMDTLETAALEGHKSLVFSQWTSLLDLLEPHLERRGLTHVRLDGATRDRSEVVRRFQSDDSISTFLVSLTAGGTGLNLTAADHVFLFEPWWNPAVEEQAADRAHRIGQERPVIVHRLVAADTVEERMLALQRDKRALAEGALGATAELTRDILLELLE